MTKQLNFDGTEDTEMATEAELVGKLMKRLHEAFPRAIIFRLEDMMTAGIPDICFNYQNLTIWFEAKVARPAFKVTGLQRMTCSRLNREGFCYFIVFIEKTRRIKIVDPEIILEPAWKQAALKESPNIRYSNEVVVDLIKSHLAVEI